MKVLTNKRLSNIETTVDPAIKYGETDAQFGSTQNRRFPPLQGEG